MVRRLVVAALLLLCPAVARAQLSPGELSQAHAALEGSANCLRCHERGKGVTADRCLVCHGALRARIAAAKGLHARPGHEACQRCHVEHQGRSFALVFWGREGRASFDHAVTGFALVGRHAKLVCEQCHAPKNIRDAEALKRGGANPAHTFLGLGTTCTSCHADPHRGQFAPRGCADCHGQEHWKPVAAFDHDHTAFPLTGRHEKVACERCHARQADGGLRFKGVLFASCTSCHKDPHAGRLGATCTSCHSTEGWTGGARSKIDHDRTRFPLRGEHRKVACARCHEGSVTTRRAFARCTDCHADRHVGQLARRADGGRCESCHDVGGFEPAHFSVADHAKTAWPLTGAHLAVPCDACHREVPVARLRAGRLTTSATAGETEQLRFASTRCTECHRDPHRGQTPAECLGCHVDTSWAKVAFDHSKTRFPLQDAHARVPCAGCHPRQGGTIAFAKRPLACAGCHADPHGGQLARDGQNLCDRCHSPRHWREIRFDHDRDTRFHLEGAHRSVACRACHRAERQGETLVIRFKPLGTRCTDCHAGARP